MTKKEFNSKENNILHFHYYAFVILSILIWSPLFLNPKNIANPIEPFSMLKFYLSKSVTVQRYLRNYIQPPYREYFSKKIGCRYHMIKYFLVLWFPSYMHTLWFFSSLAALLNTFLSALFWCLSLKLITDSARRHTETSIQKLMHP